MQCGNICHCLHLYLTTSCGHLPVTPFVKPKALQSSRKIAYVRSKEYNHCKDTNN